MTSQPGLRISYQLEPPAGTIPPKDDDESQSSLPTTSNLSIPISTIQSSSLPSLSSLADAIDKSRSILFKQLSDWKDAVANSGTEELDSGAGRTGGRSSNQGPNAKQQSGEQVEQDEDDVEEEDDEDEE